MHLVELRFLCLLFLNAYAPVFILELKVSNSYLLSVMHGKKWVF